MAASSSVAAAQALVGRAVAAHTHGHGAPHGSTPSDRLALPAAFRLSSLGGRALTSPARRLNAASPRPRRRVGVRAAAVETVGEKVGAAEELLEKSVNTIRFLAIDAVEKANSGHPGLPMGCAPMGHILYDEVMRYNPKNPYWFNRDRFILSAGHGCMLQYALLHLAGYDSVKVPPPPSLLSIHLYLCLVTAVLPPLLLLPPHPPLNLHNMVSKLTLVLSFLSFPGDVSLNSHICHLTTYKHSPLLVC